MFLGNCIFQKLWICPRYTEIYSIFIQTTCMPCLSKIPFKIFEERLTFKGFSNIFPAYCDEQTKGLYKDNRRLTILKDFCFTRVLFQLNFTNHRTAGERGAQFKFLSTSSSSFTNISIFSRQLLQWTHLCK